MKNQVRFLTALIILALAALACQYAETPTPTTELPVEFLPSATPAPSVEVVPVGEIAPSLFQEQDALIALYEHVEPGIVSIQVLTKQGGAQGSGFVIDDQGHIVTNYHVVEGAEQIQVDFPSGYKAYAELIGIDKDSDLAVIKVDAPADELFPLTLGDSNGLKVGQTVLAIGNPFGLSGTMTKGIISALGRTLPSDRESPGGGFFSAGDLIQTDAPINPGNSGGPLFNLNGEVIGVNRAILTDASNATGEPVNSGIGFAVSINIVKRVAPALIEDGKYDYPFMGIASIDSLPIDAIEALDLPQYTGAYVTSVVEDGPADKAGVIAGSKQTKISGLLGGGDLIVALDGHEIKNFDELISYLINNKGPGDTVILTIIRDGERMDLPLVLDKRP